MKTAIEHYEHKLLFEMDPSDLFSALEAKENVVVIDARKDFAFQKEHIPEAINLPHRDMNEDTTANFDKSVIYVVYCDGIGCNASTKGALNMARLGFKVKELMGGIEWWKFDGYQTKGSHQTAGLQFQCAC
ncbi:rhodanese-like domain-containing protein [Mucilaginibacter flavidus]|uniref:rhodanese-like domain-containing protein n=1 Tax=Mucilaginibacter flavidus TaxID=2949309 RepID=UPI002091EC1F|nr:rhodanese-like domain-containing protein [Mucilaginibacter flavidus]MCO5946658.1 rhodanese-like domain-containing protein [Mucilaginibacter flavidus]